MYQLLEEDEFHALNNCKLDMLIILVSLKYKKELSIIQLVWTYDVY